jgi:hypothetical protein
MGAAEVALDALAAQGSLRSQVPAMQTRARLYELLDYPAYTRFDGSVFDFALPTPAQPTTPAMPTMPTPSAMPKGAS